ncbi:SMI1/KNR4 family protein [Qipengyuania qiaonensis]|uniref:SMI1/KNR4 family protein n=1 Tax=Qipengyuania qiaonensis TaxID=2867240 RepID=A0ABS7JCK7_9SPHN|nr:SMI1/KNR4 family protein [Qipengyuania qiaonensis]MBX7482727.1 SMI1/KNR4 family protein [Qipengyuania qiaonensis]
MAEIVWEHYIDVPVKGDESAVSALETRLDVKLPESVRRTIIDHAGEAPEPSGIQVGDKSITTFGTVLYAGGTKDEARYSYSIERWVEAIARWSGASDASQLKLFPFATNTATGYFCLDYREDPAAPTIVFVDLNYDFDESTAILPVASDWEAMLAKLHD